MRIGRMRFRVEIRDFTVTKTSLNQRLKNPEPVIIGTYWADIANLSGRELINAQQIKNNVTHKVTMRWLGIPIKPTYKIMEGGRTFQVLWPDNEDNRSRVLLIYCNEEVAG